MNSSRRTVLDASRLEILSNALNAITEEIQLTLLRSAYSQVVKEAQDASCAIFTAEGRIVAQPVVIPGHLGSMRFLLADILKEFPAAAMRSQRLHGAPTIHGCRSSDCPSYCPIR